MGSKTEGLRRSIIAAQATMGSIKNAVAEQRRIIKSYKQMLKDIREGVKVNHTYSEEGLTHGIEQAEAHIDKLQLARRKERLQIAEWENMIKDIEKAEKLKAVVPVEADEDGVIKIDLNLPGQR